VAYNWPYSERYIRPVALNRLQHDFDDVPGTVIRADSMA
jgi:hypothetical protein